MPQDPQCVYVASNPAEADVVSGWLAQQGIASHVVGVDATQGAHAWLPFQEFQAKGIEVWVPDVTLRSRAMQLLAEHAELLAARSSANPSAEPIDVLCEECGVISTWPASDQGRVQNCPHCDAYLDIGEPTLGNADA